MQFLSKLEPLFEADRAAWQKEMVALGLFSTIVWQASSGLDCTVMWELHHPPVTGIHQAPQSIRSTMSATPLFLFSDYSTRVLQAMKNLYSNPEADPMTFGWKAFHPCSKGGGMIALLKDSDELPCTVRVLRILPLRLFTNATDIHRRYPDFSSAVTVASVPDEH